MSESNGNGLYDALERRALRALQPESEEPAPDLVEVLRPEGGADDVASDATLGGYIAMHDRPPAFTGSDEQPYTVGLDTEETDEPSRPLHAGFLVFVRWAGTGAGVMDHVTSPDLSWGATPDEAMQGLLDLSLYEVRAELDAAIERRRQELGF